MPDLFGIDIAGLVATAFSGNVVTGTLTKITKGSRTPGSLAAGTQPTTSSHTVQGFLDNQTEERSGAGLVSREGQFIILFTNLIDPAALPEQGDEVTMEGVTYTVKEIVARDPAAATYTLEVEA